MEYQCLICEGIVTLEIDPASTHTCPCKGLEVDASGWIGGAPDKILCVKSGKTILELFLVSDEEE